LSWSPWAKRDNGEDYMKKISHPKNREKTCTVHADFFVAFGQHDEKGVEVVGVITGSGRRYQSSSSLQVGPYWAIAFTNVAEGTGYTLSVYKKGDDKPFDQSKFDVKSFKPVFGLDQYYPTSDGVPVCPVFTAYGQSDDDLDVSGTPIGGWTIQTLQNPTSSNPYWAVQFSAPAGTMDGTSITVSVSDAESTSTPADVIVNSAACS
jgi:hypothetical protein